MHSKFPASAMLLATMVVVSNQGDVMPPVFFQQGLRVNAEIYIQYNTEILRSTVKPWMDCVAAGRPYIFQQDSHNKHLHTRRRQKDAGLVAGDT